MRTVGAGSGGRRPADVRWRPRRLAGLAVRATVVVVPFLAGLATIALGSRVVPRPAGDGVVAWYVGFCAASWVVMWLCQRLLHRLLPLAALLEMALLFPERAPSRMRLARRIASTRDLRLLLDGTAGHADETEQEAAERILTLVSALSEHDRGTRGHSERVRVLTDLIAARMGLDEHDRDRLRWAALLHDIGKLRVSATLLNKPGRPTRAEWGSLYEHPRYGAELARPLLGWLGRWGDLIVQHHEKWDGSGYPAGLSGRDICLGARIVAVADAYDVMTAARAYKKPTGRAAALRELVTCSGSHFDPDVVRALVTMPQRQLLLAMGPVAWLTGLPFVGQAPTSLGATLAGQTTAMAGAVAVTGTAVLAPVALTADAPAHRQVAKVTAPAHRSAGAKTRATRPPTAAATSGHGQATAGAAAVTSGTEAPTQARGAQSTGALHSSTPAPPVPPPDPTGDSPATTTPATPTTTTPAVTNPTGHPTGHPSHPSHPSHRTSHATAEPTRRPSPDGPTANPDPTSHRHTGETSTRSADPTRSSARPKE